MPKASEDHPFSTQVPQIVVLFGVFKKHTKNERLFLCFVLRFLFLLLLAIFVLSPQSTPRPQRSPQRAPKDSPRAPLGALQAPNASRYLVFRVCAFCFLVFLAELFQGARAGNGRFRGPFLKSMEVLNCPFLTLLSFSCRNLRGRQGRKRPIQRALSDAHGSAELPLFDFA